MGANHGAKRRAAGPQKKRRTKKQKEAARKLVELMALPTKQRHVQQAGDELAKRLNWGDGGGSE